MSSRARVPRRSPRHRLGLAVSFAIVAAPGPAAAEALPTPPPAAAQSVAVSPPLCRADWFEIVPFLDSLRVELAGRGLSCCTLAHPGDGIQAGGTLLVRVEIVPCAANADRLQVSARAPVDSLAVEREISLADVAQAARPRALALAVAELIRWLEQGVGGPRTPEAVAVQAKSPLPLPTSLPSGVARPIALSVHVDAEARALPTRDTVMWGGRVRFTAHRRSLHADLDLGASYASARGELGDVLLRSASVGLGAGPRFATATLIADLGLRAELGWAWIRGEPALADVRTGTGSSPVASVGLRLSLQAPAQGRIRPSLTLESGGVIRGVRAEVSGQPVAGMTGYYLLAALGMGVSL